MAAVVGDDAKLQLVNYRDASENSWARRVRTRATGRSGRTAWVTSCATAPNISNYCVRKPPEGLDEDEVKGKQVVARRRRRGFRFSFCLSRPVPW